MTPEEQAAYDKAKQEIADCQKKKGTYLPLVDLRLTAIPPEIGELTHLKYLDISGNRLTVLPPQIGLLVNLIQLFVTRTQIATLPSQIGQLTNLTHLNISHCQLTALPPEIGQLIKLTKLLLSYNQLTALPYELGRLMALKELLLHGNPGLGLPDDVLGPTFVSDSPKPAREILDYYFSTRGKAGAALRELRLIVVGPPKAGKTSLIRRLNREELDKNESETHSIHIRPMDFTCRDGPMHTRVWDFGGQHVLHAMHEFFLSKRCLYLLVLEQRTERTEKDAKYWLRLIRSYAGDAPVVIALNQSRGVARPLARTELERDYGPIACWEPTECLSDAECPGAGATIEKLRAALTQSMDGMQEPRQLFPVKWKVIKDELEKMTEPFLDYPAFAARCAKDEPDPAKQEELAALMNDLGVALNYARDPRLRDTTVLRPDWLANGIYAILRANILTESPLVPDGVLTAEKLGPIYAAAQRAGMLRADEYPPAKYDFLLRLMGLFRLSFPLDDRDQKHLVPSLLSPDEPKDSAEPADADRIQLRYDFDVVPAPLIGRFLVGLFPLLEPGKVWKRGGCLRYALARAKVWIDVDEKSVFATIGGPDGDRKELLVMIRETMKQMFRDYRDLDVVEHWKHVGSFVPRPALERFKVLPPEEDEGADAEALLPGEDDA